MSVSDNMPLALGAATGTAGIAALPNTAGANPILQLAIVTIAVCGLVVTLSFIAIRIAQAIRRKN